MHFTKAENMAIVKFYSSILSSDYIYLRAQGTETA